MDQMYLPINESDEVECQLVGLECQMYWLVKKSDGVVCQMYLPINENDGVVCQLFGVVCLNVWRINIRRNAVENVEAAGLAPSSNRARVYCKRAQAPLKILACRKPRAFFLKM